MFDQEYFILGISMGPETGVVTAGNSVKYFEQFQMSPLTLAETLSIIALDNKPMKRKIQIGGSTSGENLAPILYLSNRRMKLDDRPANINDYDHCIPCCSERLSLEK